MADRRSSVEHSTAKMWGHLQIPHVYNYCNPILAQRDLPVLAWVTYSMPYHVSKLASVRAKPKFGWRQVRVSIYVSHMHMTEER